MNIMYRRLYLAGIAAYIVMLVLSTVFFKERIIFLDTAFSLFHIIKNGWFNIEVYRFGDVFNQLLPVIAVKAKLPINVIVISYSIGYVVYFFTCYVICGSVLKRYDLALVILLVNTLFVSDTFYWITSQLPQAIALLIVILGALVDRPSGSIRPVASVILGCAVITLAFFHPLVVFPLAYAVIFLADTKAFLNNRRFLNMLLVIFCIFVALKATLFHTPYERHSLSGMKNFITLFPDYFRTWSNKQFLVYCLSKYCWIPILFAGALIFYVARKEWKQLFFFLTFFFGYLFLVNVSYPTNDTPVFYIESLYLPLSLFLALPFVYYLLPYLEKRKLALPVMAIILLSGSIRMYAAHAEYTARLDYERKCLDRYGNNKIIAKATPEDIKALVMLWGTPYEFLLLSESERNKSASIIIDDAPLLRDWAKDQKKALVVNWNIFPYKELNPRYFHFTDTMTGYIVEP